VDAVRFYLARVGGRFCDDVDWSEDQLRKHADEIRNALGNYFLRVTSKIIRSRAATVTTASSEPLAFRDLFSRQFPNMNFSGSPTNLMDLETRKLSTNGELLRLLDGLGPRVSRLMSNYELADALHAIVLVLRHANALLTTLEPWSEVHPPETVLSCYLTALETLRITGILLQPFIPHASKKLLDGLNIPAEERSIAYARVGNGEVGGGLLMDVRGVRLFEQPPVKKGLPEI